VEQTAVGELADAELPTEVYGSPTATAMKEDHVAGLQAECRRWYLSGAPLEGHGVTLLPFFSSFMARMASSYRMVPLMSWLKVQL
jgi:hypothetical protein